MILVYALLPFVADFVVQLEVACHAGGLVVDGVVLVGRLVDLVVADLGEVGWLGGLEATS